MSGFQRIAPTPGLPQLAAGDVVRRTYGDGFLVSEMRVARIDAAFVYCDAQRSIGEEWVVLPTGSELWKFDVVYGIETDETQGWGVGPGSRNIVLSRIAPLEETA